MTSLVFISEIGAVEGNLFTAHIAAKEEAIFFDISTNRFVPDKIQSVPIWLASPSIPPGHVLRMRFFERLVTERHVSRVLSIGLEASAYASRVLDSMSFTAILLRGDLDFSQKRTGHVANFNRVTGAAGALFFEDEFEMSKAAALGSKIPHFLYPSFSLSKTKILSIPETKRIALIHDGAGSDKQLAQLRYFEEALEELGYEGVRMDCRRLYSSGDLSINRLLAGTIRYRIGKCSRAVVFGDSRNHNTIIEQLLEQPDRVLVEDTIGNARSLGYEYGSRRARGRALLDSLVADIRGSSLGLNSVRPAGLGGSAILSKLDRAVDLEFPWFYEEFRLPKSSDFNVFFTVAPIENRTNGARPQRIRNMVEAISASGNTLVVTSNATALARKLELVKWLCASGYAPKYFYGENSTTPMATYDVLSMFSELLGVLRESECQVGWFVRDLHWLDEEIEYAGNRAARDSLLFRGMTEFEIVASKCHVLFAPDDASISGFEKLLIGRTKSLPTWRPLPPGIAESNVVHGPDEAVLEGSTLVYAGGANSVYNMDDYLDAFASLEVDEDTVLYADFIVRAEESDDLQRALEARGLTHNDRARILHMDLDDYSPRTSKAIGVILLGSDYARMAFPYKTMSMIEKGFPILTYEDMAIAGFVVDNGVGVASLRDTDSLQSAITELISSDYSNGHFSRCRDENSWSNRAQRVYEVLDEVAAG